VSPQDCHRIRIPVQGGHGGPGDFAGKEPARMGGDGGLGAGGFTVPASRRLRILQKTGNPGGFPGVPAGGEKGFPNFHLVHKIHFLTKKFEKFGNFEMNLKKRLYGKKHI
jgi:hypothetical protein